MISDFKICPFCNKETQLVSRMNDNQFSHIVVCPNLKYHEGQPYSKDEAWEWWKDCKPYVFNMKVDKLQLYVNYLDKYTRIIDCNVHGSKAKEIKIDVICSIPKSIKEFHSKINMLKVFM